MRHWKASRLLPVLPDGLLDEGTEADLLRLMPASLLPIESTPLSYARLVSLARWSPEPVARAPERLRVPVLALASAVVLFFMAASVNSWSPVVVGEGSRLELGFTRPDSDYYPTTWR